MNGVMYLIVVCAYSKYPEILCEVLFSDNGPQFVSQEFEAFCTNNGIVHKTSAAYKPSTNGQADC